MNSGWGGDAGFFQSKANIFGHAEGFKGHILSIFCEYTDLSSSAGCIDEGTISVANTMNQHFESLIKEAEKNVNPDNIKMIQSKTTKPY